MQYAESGSARPSSSASNASGKTSNQPLNFPNFNILRHEKGLENALPYTKMKTHLTLSLIYIFITPSACLLGQLAAYRTGFETTDLREDFEDGYAGLTLLAGDRANPGDPVSGQPFTNPVNQQWMTNDPIDPITFHGGSNDVGEVAGGFGTGQYYASVGGLFTEFGSYPQTTEVSVYRSLNFDYFGLDKMSFSVQMLVSESGPEEALDSFAWTLRTNGGENLLEILLEPSTTAEIGLTQGPAEPALAFSVRQWNGSSWDLIQKNGGLFYDSAYELELFLEEDGSGYLDATDFADVTSRVLTWGPRPLDFDQIDQIAASWYLTDTQLTDGVAAGAGSNALFFDEYQIVAYPEPGAFALVGAVFLVLVAARRRR